MIISPVSSQIAPKMSGSVPNPPRGTLEQTVQVVELDVKLQMLLDDVLDRDWGSYRHSSGMRKLHKQGLGVAFNGLIRNVGNSKRHLVRSLSASSKLFLLCLLRLSCKPGYVFGAQAFRCPQKVGHLTRAPADDFGQIRCDPTCQGK